MGMAMGRSKPRCSLSRCTAKVAEWYESFGTSPHSRGFAERTHGTDGAMTSDVAQCTQWHPLSALTALTRCASARAVRGACKTFTVEELFEPTLDSPKSNLRMQAESTSSRPGRCTAMVLETLAGLGMIAPACQ